MIWRKIRTTRSEFSVLIGALDRLCASKVPYVRLGFWNWIFQIFSVLRPSVWTVFSPFHIYIFKPFLKSWRSRGISIAIFLDDGLGGEADPVSAKINSLVVHSDPLKSGFVPNEDKSQWEPIQIIKENGN